MTIDELITELQRRKELHGGQTEVLVTWEGIWRQISCDGVWLSKVNDLAIDADGNYYKAAYQHPDDIKNNPNGQPFDLEESY